MDDIEPLVDRPGSEVEGSFCQVPSTPASLSRQADYLKWVSLALLIVQNSSLHDGGAYLTASSA